MSSREYSVGSTPRAFSVLSSNGGIITAKLILPETGTETLYTRLPSMAEATRPPEIAGLVLSGCPSICAARLMRSLCDIGEPSMRFAPKIPATMHAEELPRPRAIGMLFS